MATKKKTKPRKKVPLRKTKPTPLPKKTKPHKKVKGKKKPLGKGILAVLSWEWNDAKLAEEAFGRYRAKGRGVHYLAQGKIAEPMLVFDPQAGQMAITPRPTAWDKIRENAA
jgi:hypothetical protein